MKVISLQRENLNLKVAAESPSSSTVLDPKCCQMMTNEPEMFSFSQSFWNRLDKEEQRTREADNSFNQSGHQRSLPVQDYNNVTRRKDEAVRRRHADQSVQGLNSPAEQSQKSFSSNDQKRSRNDRRRPKLRERSQHENVKDWRTFDEEVASTLRQVNPFVLNKQKDLEAGAEMEKSLKAECERMKDENDKLKKLNFVKVTFHREVMTKLNEDLQSMTAV